MRETHKLLKEAQLRKAETEMKELIAKLQHLRNLLLAEDLDFQLKLRGSARCGDAGSARPDRQGRTARAGLVAIRRGERKRLTRFTTRQPDLEAFVNDQQALIADTKKSSKKGETPSKDALRPSVTGRSRSGTRRTVSRPTRCSQTFSRLMCAAPTPGWPMRWPSWTRATRSRRRGRGQGTRPVPTGAHSTGRTGEADGADDRRGRIPSPHGDQAKNRGAAENLEATSSRLGDVGVALRKDLIHAGAAMQSAERGLEKGAAGSAAEEQSAALDVLVRSREDFARAIERLLVELRTELQGRLDSELSGMHETQMSVRETSQAQAPRVAQKSRTALITVAGLSKKEAEMAERTETLLALVEETEFGIALPTTLRILSREMRSIEGWLKAATSPPARSRLRPGWRKTCSS